MLRFNIQKAKAAGYDDKTIAQMIQAGPPTAQAQPVQQQPQGNLLTSLLPLIGSIVGGTLAAPLPGGVIWGSAAGSGLGEFGKQALTGGNYNLKSILGETATGAVGGGIASLLGRAAKAGRAVEEVGAAAKGAGAIEKAGTNLKASPYVEQAIGKLKGRNISARAAAIGETANTIKGATATSKLSNIGRAREELNAILEGVTNSPEAKATKVPGIQLLKDIRTQAGTEVDLTSGIGKANMKQWGPQIAQVKNQSDLGKLNAKLLKIMAGLPESSEKKKVLLALQKPLGEIFKTGTGTENIYASLSGINAAEPIVQAQAATGAQFGPIKSRIPIRAVEAMKAGTGGAIEKVGQLASSPLGGQIGGQLGARALMGGTGTESYQPTPETQPTEQYTTPTEKPKFNITAEQVALARLTLPKAQADAIESAYKIMNPSGATSASQEFISKALQTISTTKTQKTLGFGPIKGRAYALQMEVGGGTGVPADVVSLYQKYEILRLNVLRAYQGARISDADFKLAQRYIPNVMDTNTTAAIKLNLLDQLLSTAEPPTKGGTYEQKD